MMSFDMRDARIWGNGRHAFAADARRGGLRRRPRGINPDDVRPRRPLPSLRPLLRPTATSAGTTSTSNQPMSLCQKEESSAASVT